MKNSWSSPSPSDRYAAPDPHAVHFRMSHVARNTSYATPAQGVARSAAWVLRWLLVLVLMMDQIGSPLHRHHHDSGIDSSSIHGQHPGSLPVAHHIDDDDRESSTFHAVTTLRAVSRMSAPDTPSQDDPQPTVLAVASSLPWLEVEASGSATWADPAAPPHKLHRSLPPAGRAPPARA